MTSEFSPAQFSPGISRIAARTGRGWVVGDRLYAPPFLITAEIVGSVPGLSLATLDARQLPDIGPIDLLLLGTGAAQLQAGTAFLQSAAHHGWRVEAMDSAAAARTFNVLVAEERLVAALLF